MKTPQQVDRESKKIGRWLYFFAAYTLLIKYILPIAWSILQKEPLTRFIYFWDAWWAIHIAVGYGLIKCRPKVWIPAVLLSLAEIVIIGTKFVVFLKTPNWDFWHLNWFVNKCFLWVFFWILLVWLFQPEVRKLYEKR